MESQKLIISAGPMKGVVLKYSDDHNKNNNDDGDSDDNNNRMADKSLEQVGIVDASRILLVGTCLCSSF